jgi:hypothetical protein
MTVLGGDDSAGYMSPEDFLDGGGHLRARLASAYEPNVTKLIE